MKERTADIRYYTQSAKQNRHSDVTAESSESAVRIPKLVTSKVSTFFAEVTFAILIPYARWLC